MKVVKGTNSSYKINKSWRQNVQLGAMANNTVLCMYLKVAKKVHLKSPHYKEKIICKHVRRWMLTRLTVVIVSH